MLKVLDGAAAVLPRDRDRVNRRGKPSLESISWVRPPSEFFDLGRGSPGLCSSDLRKSAVLAIPHPRIRLIGRTEAGFGCRGCAVV